MRLGRVHCGNHSVSIHIKRKLYWVRWVKYENTLEFMWGTDHQCKCTEDIGFAPCPDCGAGV